MNNSNVGHWLDKLDQLQADTTSYVLDRRRQLGTVDTAADQLESLVGRASRLAEQIANHGDPPARSWAFGDATNTGFLTRLGHVFEALVEGRLDDAEEQLGTTTRDLADPLENAAPSLTDQYLAARTSGASPAELWTFRNRARRIAPGQVSQINELLREDGIYMRPGGYDA